MEACPAGVRGGAEEVALGAGQAAGGEGGSSWGAEATSRVLGVGAAAPLVHLVGVEAAVPSAHLAVTVAGPGEGGEEVCQGEAEALPSVAGEAAAPLVGVAGEGAEGRKVGAGEGAGGRHRLLASRCAAGLREDASAGSSGELRGEERRLAHCGKPGEGKTSIPGS